MKDLLLLALLLVTACVARPAERTDTPPNTTARPLSLLVQESGTSALLQAVSAMNERVVWASGHGGTYTRTIDGGATWSAAIVPGADSMQFRDVHAVDASAAYLLAAGPGERSRIYKTVDAGRTWTLQFVNRDPRAFYDCMDFWDADNGMAFSDAVDGRLPVIVTSDGGATWTLLPNESLPAAPTGEGGFAASGTCLVARGAQHAWIGTGGAAGARVLRSSDRGRSWTAVTTPIVRGEGAGITSLAFLDTLRGAALGGSIGKPREPSDSVAVTVDGGRSWSLGGRPSFQGAAYGGAYVPGTAGPTMLAVGPGGAAYSLDNGRNWLRVDTLPYWSVAFAPHAVGWAVGPRGRIARLAVR